MSLHWGACCFHQCHERVAISQELPHNLQAYFLLRRIGCCQLSKTVVISSGTLHNFKTESSLMRLCFYQVHERVLTSEGLPHNLQAYFFGSRWLLSIQQLSLSPQDDHTF